LIWRPSANRIELAAAGRQQSQIISPCSVDSSVSETGSTRRRHVPSIPSASEDHRSESSRSSGCRCLPIEERALRPEVVSYSRTSAYEIVSIFQLRSATYMITAVPFSSTPSRYHLDRRKPDHGITNNPFRTLPRHDSNRVHILQV